MSEAPSRTNGLSLDLLGDLKDPADGRPIPVDVAASRLVLDPEGVLSGQVVVTARLGREAAERIEAEVVRRLSGLPGASEVRIAIVAQGASGTQDAPEPSAMPRGREPDRRVPDDGGRHDGLADVRAVIAVASGKGGVGKSTVAVNLAVALAEDGLAVGLMDADVYGPSLPLMLGRREKPRVDGSRRLVPLDAFGLKSMSMGYLIDPDKAAVWRGPMVAGAVAQLLGDVAWGPLDLLIVDMPPGTGDAQLTLAQKAALAGAVIVSTPQDLALADARRAVAMFERVGVPILGIVENMSAFVCPHCGGTSHVFGHGGAADEAAERGVPFLGEVPLEMPVRESADLGRPVVLSHPDSRAARALKEIAGRIRVRLADGTPRAT